MMANPKVSVVFGKKYMSKSFTLIEMLVTIGIVILIAAASGPALDQERNRANFNDAVQQIRDLISETQTYAFAPERNNASDYGLEMNFGSASTGDLDPNQYGIYARFSGGSSLIKTGKLQPVTISAPAPINIGSNILAMTFRTTDGVIGFRFPGSSQFLYYDSAGWINSSIQTQITLGGQTKTIEINNITGETEVAP